MSGVAFLAIKQGQCRDRFFRIRVELNRGLEFVFRFLQIVVETVKPAEKQVIVNVVGFDFDDSFVLLDG